MVKLLKINVILAILLCFVNGAFGVGVGAISGTVTDSQGDPIAGLAVEAEDAEMEDEYDDDDDDEIFAVTNANGFYIITDLPPGSYYVEACAGCTGLFYVNELYDNTTNFDLADEVTVTASNTTSGINFQLVASGGISGTVTDSEGDPISGLWVEAMNYDDEEAMDMDAETDANGYYIITGLPPGDYKVETLADDSDLSYVDEYYDNITNENSAERVTLVGTSITSGIDFVLGLGGSITGTVTDAQGDPIVNLDVWTQIYTSDDGGCGDGETDANGFYEITGLASGSYRVATDVDWSDLEIDYVDEFYNNTTDWMQATAVTVTAPNTTSGIDFSLVVGTSISGYIYGWNSNSSSYVALEDAQVFVEYFDSSGGWGYTESDSSGFYEITGVAVGEYRVRVEKYPYIEKYYPNAIDWSEAEALVITVSLPATGINFNLDLGGSITGTILDANSSEPVTEGWVSANPTNGEPWGRGAHEIDNNGFYIISGLPAGTYKVSASSDGYDEEFYENEVDWMMATEVTVVVGQTMTGVDFTLQPEVGGKIIGQIVLAGDIPVENAWVNANSMEHMKWKNGETDANGVFEITGITPGQWQIQAQPPWGEEYRDVSPSNEMFIDVSEGATVTDIGKITLPTVNLIGRVLMPDDSPASWVPINIETPDWSYWAWTQTDNDGYFSQGGLTAGTYKLRVELPWGTSGIVPPEPQTFEITDPNSILDLGVIKYVTAAKHITGKVQRSDESGVPNVEVNGWRWGQEGWVWTQTDSNGDFSLDVATGTWELMIHPGYMDNDVNWVYLSHPKVVTFADDSNEETKTVTFTVESAGSKVTGTVLGPNGETIRQGATWIDIRDDQGRGNGMPVENGGVFSISVSAGTYNIWIGVDTQTYPYWSSPRIDPFEIGGDETLNLGTINLIEKTSGIQGTITRSSDSEPVSGVSIYAWQHEGGWTDTTSDDNGNYQLSVTAGDWEVAAEPPYNSNYISGQPPRRIVVEDGQTVTNVNFELVEADGTIKGSLYDSNSNLLTDIDGGWAYAREDEFSYEPMAGAPVANGQFTLKVPLGTYYVGVYMSPNSGYTLDGDAQITVTSGTDAEVNLTLLTNDATITGTFYTDANKTTPATNLEGEVFAMQNMGGVWQNTRINSDNGTYELQVASGEWNLGYWIMSDGYINNPPPDSRVTVESGENATFDFVLVDTDATIEGVVLDPNGDPITHAWVWAHSEGDGENERIDGGGESQEPDGSFSINVPSGRTYDVGAHAPETWGYIQPEMQTVTPASGSTVQVQLRFKNSDGVISGFIYYQQDGNDVNCPNAWVNAWSDDGQHTGTSTDNDGQYQLNISTGTIWHIDAVYHVDGEANFYETDDPTNVNMRSSTATINLLLTLSDETIPAATSATFDPNVGWTGTLEDGMQLEIPAGAIPASSDVSISLTPLIENLQETHNDKPLGYGYAISLTETSTGNPIKDNFNTNVLITFTYSDEDLAEEGLTADDISPSYFSTTTNSWTKVESFTIDKEANSITVQINHFSIWALTGDPNDEAGSTETSTIDLTIIKCKVKAGRTPGRDNINFKSRYDDPLTNITDANQIVVNITSVTDSNLIYTETIAFDPNDIKRNKYKYKKRISRGDPGTGAIKNLLLNLNKKKLSINFKNVDLTGLGSPVKLEVTIGDYVLSGQVGESVINRSKKTIPTRLMRSYSDTLLVKKVKVKSGRGDSSDKLTVKGEIAVKLVDSTNLTNEDVVLTWGDQTFTIPSGSFTVIRGKKYRCRKISVTGGLVSGKIDLDKCKFNLTLKNASLTSKSGTVDFGLKFAGFDETDPVTLP